MKRLLIILVSFLLFIILSFAAVWFVYGLPRVDKIISSQQNPTGTVVSWKPENNLLTLRFDSGLFFKDIKINLSSDNNTIFVSTGVKKNNKLIMNNIDIVESALNYQQAFCVGDKIEILKSSINNYINGKFVGNNDILNLGPNICFQK